MNKFLIVILLLISPTLVLAKSYCKSDAQACYLTLEATGTTTVDSSSVGNGGTASFNSSGHPAWSATGPTYGKTGSASESLSYSSAGSAEILTSGTSNNLVPYNSAWSYCSWINPTTDSINGGDNRLFVRGSVYVGFSTVHKFYINIDGSTPLLRFTAANTVTLSSWGHFCVTGDGSTTATNYKMYYNGAEVTYNDAAKQDGVTLTSNAGATLYIGNVSTGTRSINGTMTQVAFWNRVLSAAEIAEIYNYGLLGNTNWFQLF